MDTNSQIPFEILDEISKKLAEAKANRIKFPIAIKYIEELNAAIMLYKTKGTMPNPDLSEKINGMVRVLSTVPKDIMTSISQHAAKACRECMFHTDDCFVNVIFLVSKSIEMGQLIEPNNVRPAMRFLNLMKK